MSGARVWAADTVIRMRRFSALIALMVLFAACGSAGTQETAAPPSVAPAPTGPVPSDAAPPSAPASGPTAGPFAAVPAVGGGEVDGAALAGRDVALWFWAPW